MSESSNCNGQDISGSNSRDGNSLKHSSYHDLELFNDVVDLEYQYPKFSDDSNQIGLMKEMFQVLDKHSMREGDECLDLSFLFDSFGKQKITELLIHD